MYGSNTIDTELIAAIEKANKLGINIITDGSKPSAKCLSISIIDDVPGGVNQVAFEMVGKDGETTSIRSPFTWEMNKEKFLEWVSMANKSPLRRINRTLSKMIRLMPMEKFDALRRITNLEKRFIEMMRNEFAFLGINVKGVNLPMLHHLTLIYGGIFDRKGGTERFLDAILDMVIDGIYRPDRCRSCRYCLDYSSGLRYCNCMRNEFSLPLDTTIGSVVNEFPDLSIQKVGNSGYAKTHYIPENQKSCAYYKRRF